MNINRLESWYLKHHRKLSFRDNQDPYPIWVSEIMLQQTQVETVLPFFNRFIMKYPTISDLANESEENLKKTVEGIGYYRRFKLMHMAAKEIVSKYDGMFPDTYEKIIKLPGIGKYTAGAIMSICFNKPYSALDGNVIRVLSRFYEVDLDMRTEKNRKVLDKLNQEWIQKSTPRIYTQAMMELGALICRPKLPKCDQCPLREDCKAFLNNRQLQLPYLSKAGKKKEFNYIVLMILENDTVILNKRSDSLLNGMYEYPQFESDSINQVLSDLEIKGVSLDVIEKFGEYKHVFTHQIWHMSVYLAKRISGILDGWVFADFEMKRNLPMAVAHKKIRY